VSTRDPPAVRWIEDRAEWFFWPRKSIYLYNYGQYVTCYFHTYVLTYLLTYLGVLTRSLTLRSRVLLEKLTGSQLVKKFPAFYGKYRFITAFTSACHLFLSWASSIQSIPPHPTSWRSSIILSYVTCWFP